MAAPEDYREYCANCEVECGADEPPLEDRCPICGHESTVSPVNAPGDEWLTLEALWDLGEDFRLIAQNEKSGDSSQ